MCSDFHCRDTTGRKFGATGSQRDATGSQFAPRRSFSRLQPWLERRTVGIPQRSEAKARIVACVKVRHFTTGAACVGVYRGGGGSAVGAEAPEERRSDSEHLTLDIEESKTRLSTGRKGASPPAPPLARPLPHHEGQNTLRYMEGTLRPPHRIGWRGGWLGGGTNLLPHPALPRPERDEPARPRLMRCAYQRWRVVRVRMLLWGRRTLSG